jgi:hypothetical protein
VASSDSQTHSERHGGGGDRTGGVRAPIRQSGCKYLRPTGARDQEPSAGISSLVHNPSVLILDEATGALDNASQAVVTQAMQALDATRIVIDEAVPRERIQAN